MINCSKCNKEIEEKTNYCPYCGEQLAKKVRLEKHEVHVVPRIILIVILALIYIPYLFSNIIYVYFADIPVYFTHVFEILSILSVIVCLIFMKKYKNDNLIRTLSIVHIVIVSAYLLYAAFMLALCASAMAAC